VVVNPKTNEVFVATDTKSKVIVFDGDTGAFSACGAYGNVAPIRRRGWTRRPCGRAGPAPEDDAIPQRARHANE
jgi:hypothetical protein